MGRPRKRSIDEVDGYQSDGGFVSNSDGKTPQNKKPKKVTDKLDEPAQDDEGNPYWQLSSGRNQRRVGVQEFKNTQMVNIREFYEKDNRFLPGKKGISLNIDQYKALLQAIPHINKALRGKGVDISEPDLAMKDEDGSEADTKPLKRVRTKQEKSNIEATSDEEE
ncbi:hypothetical protein BP5796_02339 [Coleophoma crateriformis]|uniref:Transcriptional coactivator p15 (PC4) C-terminal domain-containing protein n=1 Tax=Coleophoma crateriformis TaxID=565419 RepID=A0A3D8SY25_9HELO|nr:hypothetical protein BP5796_02339 [Coleophoma crateriformis]